MFSKFKNDIIKDFKYYRMHPHMIWLELAETFFAFLATLGLFIGLLRITMISLPEHIQNRLLASNDFEFAVLMVLFMCLSICITVLAIHLHRLRAEKEAKLRTTGELVMK